MIERLLHILNHSISAHYFFSKDTKKKFNRMKKGAKNLEMEMKLLNWFRNNI